MNSFDDENRHNRYAEASECDCRYHIGKCAGISVETDKAKGEVYCKAWRCATCRGAKMRSQPVQQLSSDSDMQDIRIWLKTINEKLDQVLKVKATVENIEDSLQFMSEQYDEFLARTEQNERAVKDMHRRLNKLKTRDKEIAKLEAVVDNLEWRSRQQNLEFHGLELTKNEDLLAKINALSQKLEVPPLSKDDVVTIHRLPARRDNIPGIICCFAKLADRENWWQNRKKLVRSDDSPFILENLTRRTRALLFEAKNWAKEAHFKYVWHNNGRVLVRKADRDKVAVVTCVGGLSKLVS
ncbi:uncharacterized protein LOC144161537 [Haemaphysalis longicornis]